jgi:hypothetical protein
MMGSLQKGVLMTRERRTEKIGSCVSGDDSDAEQRKRQIKMDWNAYRGSVRRHHRPVRGRLG